MRLVSFVLMSVLLTPSAAHAFTLEFQSEQGWTNNAQTFLVNYTNCPVSNDVLNAAIDAGVNLWNSVSTTNVKLTRGGTTGDLASDAQASPAVITDSPVILCDNNFTTNVGQGDTNVGNHVTAVTFVRSNSSGQMAFAVMVLNSDTGKSGNIANFDATQLSDIVSHEMGHAMGLGHSGLQEALMYYVSDAKTTLNLAQDDVDGITFLYPRQEPTSGFMGCGTLKNVGKGGGSDFPGAGAAVLALWVVVCGGMVLVLKGQPSYNRST